MTSESQLLAAIRSLLDEPIFLGQTSDDLQVEIQQNSCRLSADSSECARLTTEDVELALMELIDRKREQVRNAACGHGAIFYLWHDDMAGQLRFNIISDFHAKLPFGCRLDLVPAPTPIIEAFLRSPYLEGIPWSELEKIDFDAPEPSDADVILKVYQLHLP